jgi:predicted RNA-binding Zn ribbon-like protein
MTATYDDPRFRITPFPGNSPYPHPPVVPWPMGWQIEAGVLRPDEGAPRRRVDGASEPGPIVEAGEIYLELTRVDLEDEDAILTFVERFGALGIRHNDFELVMGVPRFAAIRGALERAWSPKEDPLRLLRAEESLSDFRYGARIVRDMVNAWRVLRDSHGAVEWESIPHGMEVIDLDEGEHLNGQHAAAIFLEHALNSGLRSWHPRIVRGDFGSDPSQLIGFDEPLYATCCLELYNHLVEHAEYRRCENPTCRRLFVHQRGRSQANQRRTTGVIYCSAWCGRAVAQRRYRRRKKQSDPAAEGGQSPIRG